MRDLMIFIHRHEHRWKLTAALVHGSRVSVCVVCGDRAYDPQPGGSE